MALGGIGPCNKAFKVPLRFKKKGGSILTMRVFSKQRRLGPTKSCIAFFKKFSLGD